MAEGINELDDSDDESLPDISNFFSQPCTSDISKGDIVWAKFKNLYWPALVRCIYRKEKKISVWFTDEPGKTFKLPFKNVCSFHDADMRTKIEKDVKEAGCVQEHEGLTSHAVRYLKRKAEGYVDDPMKFFDQTYPFFIVEEYLRKNPGTDVVDIKIPPLYISHNQKSIRKSINVQNISSSNSESELEYGSESNSEDVPKDYLSKVSEVFASSTKGHENIDNIVRFVLSGKADDYLKKILTGNVPSKHRDAYKRHIASNAKHTNSLTYGGPITDQKKLKELLFYLLPLYERMTTTQRSRYPTRRSKTKKINYTLCPKTLDINSSLYVGSVWLPEAIIYAMSDVYNVSLEDAKQLFEKKSEIDSTDIERIFSILDSELTTSDSKGIKQKSSHQNENNIKICSPLKKICV